MSREIKFRAQDKNGKWLYGFVAMVTIAENIHWWKIFNFDNGSVGTPVDPKTIGQYTGLKDKSGTEIYEGDILVCKLNKPAVVVYFNYQASFKIKYSSGTMYDLVPDIDLLTVIGNIHENPELLEASNESNQ